MTPAPTIHPLIVSVCAATTDPLMRAMATEAAATADAAIARGRAATAPAVRAAAVAAFEAAIRYWCLHAPVAPLVGWVEAQRVALGQPPGTLPHGPMPRVSRRFGNPI
jgi:hypothetical protein